MMACLKRCDARTLRQLKAVSKGWQQRARRALWDRLDAEEVDVEELQHFGLHEAVAAVRQMPNLARLRGYGFRVELDGPHGVRQAALGSGYESGPLGGAALRGCIHEGEGEPPHQLRLLAVACAARGTVLGVPVQQLREDNAIGSLNLNNKHFGVIGAELLSLMLPAATSLRELRRAAGTTPLAQRAQLAFQSPHTIARSPPEVIAFASAPVDLPSHHSPSAPRLQSRVERDRSRGRRRARCHPQGDEHYDPVVRRRPRVSLCVSAP